MMDLSPPPPKSFRLGRAEVVISLYGTLALTAIAWGAARGDANLYRLAERSTPLRLALSPLVGVACGLAVVFLTRFAVHRFDWARALHREFRSVIGPVGLRETFVLALASSVGEELLFRGAMLPAIGPWASSAIFALLHIGPGRHFLPWTLASFVIGLALCGLFLAMGDLGGPIAAHLTINFLNLRHIATHEHH